MLFPLVTAPGSNLTLYISQDKIFRIGDYAVNEAGLTRYVTGIWMDGSVAPTVLSYEAVEKFVARLSFAKKNCGEVGLLTEEIDAIDEFWESLADPMCDTLVRLESGHWKLLGPVLTQHLDLMDIPACYIYSQLNRFTKTSRYVL